MIKLIRKPIAIHTMLLFRSETVVIKPTSQDDMLLHRPAMLREEQSDSALLTQSANASIGGLSSTPRSLEDSTSSHDQSLGATSKEHKLQLVDNVLMSKCIQIIYLWMYRDSNSRYCSPFRIPTRTCKYSNCIPNFLTK